MRVASHPEDEPGPQSRHSLKLCHIQLSHDAHPAMASASELL